MKVTFIGHASLLIGTKGLRMLSDSDAADWPGRSTGVSFRRHESVTDAQIMRWRTSMKRSWRSVIPRAAYFFHRRRFGSASFMTGLVIGLRIATVPSIGLAAVARR
jgi:hypothetical protein